MLSKSEAELRIDELEHFWSSSGSTLTLPNALSMKICRDTLMGMTDEAVMSLAHELSGIDRIGEAADQIPYLYGMLLLAVQKLIVCYLNDMGAEEVLSAVRNLKTVREINDQ